MMAVRRTTSARKTRLATRSTGAGEAPRRISTATADGPATRSTGPGGSCTPAPISTDKQGARDSQRVFGASWPSPGQVQPSEHLLSQCPAVLAEVQLGGAVSTLTPISQSVKNKSPVAERAGSLVGYAFSK